MTEVEVLIDNFDDLHNRNKEITITRNGKTMTVVNQLLQKGDRYSITKDRYDELSKIGIVSRIKKESKSNKDSNEINQEENNQIEER